MLTSYALKWYETRGLKKSFTGLNFVQKFGSLKTSLPDFKYGSFIFYKLIKFLIFLGGRTFVSHISVYRNISARKLIFTFQPRKPGLSENYPYLILSSKRGVSKNLGQVKMKISRDRNSGLYTEQHLV